jgi:hypothetical protein
MRLEEELGVRLLQRTTRKLSLTAVGRTYFDQVRGALALIEEAGTSVSSMGEEPRDVVRVTAPPSSVRLAGEHSRATKCYRASRYPLRVRRSYRTRLSCSAWPRGYSACHQTKRQAAHGPDALRVQWPLRHAFYHCARVAVIRDLPSKSYYTALRRRGHTHGRSLRAVADRLLRILIAMLTTRTLFDCSKARTREIVRIGARLKLAASTELALPKLWTVWPVRRFW